MATKDRRLIARNEFKKFYDKLKSNFDNGFIPNLLDVGACDGEDISVFREWGISASGLDLNPGIDVVLKGSMENIPTRNNIFDFIYSSHSFEHTTNPIQTIKEFHRVLKPGGFVFMITPFLCDEQLFTCDETHLFVLTLEQQVCLFQKFGFRIVKYYIIKNEGDPEKDVQQILIGVKI